MKKSKYRLYWMYDNSIPNQDPLKDGYIGITSRTLKSRLATHKTQKYSPGIKVHKTKLSDHIDSMKDINDLTIKELCWSYDDNAISLIEKAFRPTKNIGWNIHPGGKDIFGISKPFAIYNKENQEVARYDTFFEARKDGWHDGNLSEHLRKPEKRKTVRGYTARYL